MLQMSALTLFASFGYIYALINTANELRMNKMFSKSIFTLIALFCLFALPLQAHAKPAKGKVNKVEEVTKERLVLMPLRLGEEDQKLQGAIETALVEGLQQKYEVFSGEQVAKKAREIFNKESHNMAHKECDETRCLQGIAEAFQAELLAIASVTKDSGGYFIALSIRNLYDNKDVYSKSLPCKGCDAYAVVDKLKELVGAPATVASAPAPEAPPAKVNLSDPETALWEEAKKGNAEEDYQAYLTTYPKGKYAPLAKTKLARLKDEARAAAEQQDQQAWNAAQQGSNQDSYATYLSLYPQGQFAALAQGRIDKIKREASAAEATQRREQAAAEAKRKQEQAATAERQKREVAATPKGFVSQGGLTWMPINSLTMNWSDANAYCSNTAINGQNGWRLPTKDELSALYSSGAMNGQGWTLHYTWSSTPGSAGYHYFVYLLNGGVSASSDTGYIYVPCVR
jgi:hypothetical protein